MHIPDGTEFEKTNAWKYDIKYVQINVRFGISTHLFRLAFFLFKAMPYKLQRWSNMTHRPDGTEFERPNAWKYDIKYVHINVRFGISTHFLFLNKKQEKKIS